MKRFDRTRPEFSPYGFTCEMWTPTRMPRPDKHNEIEFNLLKTGSLTYLLGGHRITIEAGRLAVFWAAIPHQIVAFEGEEPVLRCDAAIERVPGSWARIGNGPSHTGRRTGDRYRHRRRR